PGDRREFPRVLSRNPRGSCGPPRDEALENSEELHRAIAELASDFALIARVEPDGTLVPEAATDGFGAVTGYTLDELQERGWGVLIHPEDMPPGDGGQAPSAVRRTHRRGEPDHSQDGSGSLDPSSLATLPG